MDDLRALIAVVIFSICTYLVYDLFANGFSWSILIACIVGFWSVHYIWPRNQNDSGSWYDILEIVIDFPYRSIANSLRAIGKLFRRSDGDIDIDL